MLYNTIKCTAPDDITLGDFIAAINLLGAIENVESKTFFILALINKTGNSHGNTVSINDKFLTYKNINYYLGEYKRLLYKIIRDIKDIRVLCNVN